MKKEKTCCLLMRCLCVCFFFSIHCMLYVLSAGSSLLLLLLPLLFRVYLRSLSLLVRVFVSEKKLNLLFKEAWCRRFRHCKKF